MFDWVEFNPERLTQPATLSAIILAVAGLLIALFAGTIASAVNSSRVKKGKIEFDKAAFIFRTFGTALIIIGLLVAFLTI